MLLRVYLLAALFAVPTLHAADWRAATPEEQGMDSRALATLVEFGGNAEIDSLVVVRNGRIVTEAYYAPFRTGMRHRINSATKGVVGMLAGIAVARGVLPATETPAFPLLGQNDPGKAGITIQHLLDASSGLEWREPLTDINPQSLIEMQRQPDWVRYVLDRPVAAPPGQQFNYSSGDWHLLSALIARKSGVPTQEFARKHLFEPLGITDWRWRTDPRQTAIGGWGLYMTTRDMARLGQLYLDGGRFDGREIVPQAWVDKVFRPSVVMQPMATYRYADGWWIIPSRGAFMMNGYQRQIVVVLPQERIVAATTGRGGYPFENLMDHLKKAVRSESALPPDAQANAQLQNRINEAALDIRLPNIPTPALAQQVSGRTYRLPANPLSITDFTLHLEGAGAYETTTGGRKIRRSLGLQGWTLDTLGESADPLYSRAAWVRPDTLMVVARWPEEGRGASYLMKFDGPRVHITYTPPFGPPVQVTGEATP